MNYYSLNTFESTREYISFNYFGTFYYKIGEFIFSYHKLLFPHYWCENNKNGYDGAEITIHGVEITLV